MNSGEQFTQLTLFSLSPSTYLIFAAPTTMPLDISSADWWARMPRSFQHEDSAGAVRVWLLDQRELPAGVAWTLDTGVSRNVGNASSSLADVLETSVAPKYYLSPRACQGILRRAAKRGKELPPALQAALEAVANRDA